MLVALGWGEGGGDMNREDAGEDNGVPEVATLGVGTMSG